MAPILGLASETGAVLEVYKRLLRDNSSEEQAREVLKQELGDVLWFCASIATANNLSLDEIAEYNLTRARNRYGDLKPSELPNFDANSIPEQRFPRRLVVKFTEVGGQNGRKQAQLHLVAAEPNAFPKGSRTAINGKRIGYDVGQVLGDPLTDHQRNADAYRFHDAIHLGFMAVLGWSPVMRYMLRIKRKADADAEEGDDSARQVFAEEGLAAVLAQLAKKRLGFLHERSVNETVLDIVHAITMDVEARACPDRLWAAAITQGFQVLHQLSQNGGGYVIANLDTRTLEYRKQWP